MEALIVILGLATGYFIASQTKAEIKQGRKYFTIIQAAVLAGVAAVLLFPNYLLLSIITPAAFAVGLFFNYAVPIMFLFGLASYDPKTAPLAFIYALPASAKEYPNWKKLTAAAIMYAAGFTIAHYVF